MSRAVVSSEKTKWNNEIPDKDKIRNIKRRALLNAAAQIFNERGYHRTTLDHVSKSLGVSKPTLYYYIKNKEDILFQCSHMALSDMQDALQSVGDTSRTGRECLEDLMSQYFDLVITDFGKCLVMCDVHAFNDENKKILLEARRKIDNAVQEIIRNGVADKSIADCNARLTTFAIFGAYNWICRWYDNEGEMTAEDVKEGFMNMLVNGLGPR